MGVSRKIHGCLGRGGQKRQVMPISACFDALIPKDNLCVSIGSLLHNLTYPIPPYSHDNDRNFSGGGGGGQGDQKWQNGRELSRVPPMHADRRSPVCDVASRVSSVCTYTWRRWTKGSRFRCGLNTAPSDWLASALLPNLEMRLAWCPTVRSHKLTHLSESQNSPQKSPKNGQKELEMGENVRSDRKHFQKPVGNDGSTTQRPSKP